MKTEKNILVAFLLNIGFSIFELIGGIFTGSIAILSDSLHRRCFKYWFILLLRKKE